MLPLAHLWAREEQIEDLLASLALRAIGKDDVQTQAFVAEGEGMPLSLLEIALRYFNLSLSRKRERGI